VADRESLRGLPPNAEVGLDIDRARFVNLLVEAIASFG
jgi:inosine-uridine nucleoside N-ribohydrolase